MAGITENKQKALFSLWPVLFKNKIRLYFKIQHAKPTK